MSHSSQSPSETYKQISLTAEGVEQFLDKFSNEEFEKILDNSIDLAKLARYDPSFSTFDILELYEKNVDPQIANTYAKHEKEPGLENSGFKELAVEQIPYKTANAYFKLGYKKHENPFTQEESIYPIWGRDDAILFNKNRVTPEKVATYNNDNNHWVAQDIILFASNDLCGEKIATYNQRYWKAIEIAAAEKGIISREIMENYRKQHPDITLEDIAQYTELNLSPSEVEGAGILKPRLVASLAFSGRSYNKIRYELEKKYSEASWWSKDKLNEVISAFALRGFETDEILALVKKEDKTKVYTSDEERREHVLTKLTHSEKETLKKTFNITSFEKYDPATLKESVKNLDLAYNAGKPIALEIAGKSNPSNFIDGSWRTALAKTHKLFVAEYENSQQALEFILFIGSLNGFDSKGKPNIPITYLQFSDHGTKQGLQGSEDNCKINIRLLKKDYGLAPFVTDMIVLSACSTGEGGAHEDNFASAVMNHFTEAKELYAATAETLSPLVDTRGPRPKVHLGCGKENVLILRR